MASKKNTVEMTLEAKDKASPVIGKLGKNLKNFRKETDSTSGSIRGMRGGLQNLGHQFQDIAVQVQSNTNPFTIFAQQGSQIASSFGPGGAMIGALIAVTGALGTGLAPALFDSADAADQLDDSMDILGKTISMNENGVISLSSEIKKLSSISLNLARLDISVDIVKSDKLIKTSKEALKESFEKATQAYAKYNKGLSDFRNNRGFRNKSEELAKAYGIEVSELNILTRAYENFSKAPTTETANSLASVLLKLDSNKEAFTELVSSVAKASSSFVLATENSNLLGDALEDLEGTLFSVSASKFEDSFVGLLDSESSLDDFFSGQDDNMKLHMSSLSSMTSAYNQFFSNLANASKEGSTAQKVFFAVAQSISAAQSIISGFSAASKVREAYAGIIGGQAISEPMANSYIGLGFANAGIIAGQTIASFDGGGFTGSGSRTGGLDGKGGFPALLHKNETVIDHTKGQGMAPKIEVYNYSGQQAQVLTEGDVTRIVVGQMSNANSAGRRGLVQTSNLQNRGVR